MLDLPTNPDLSLQLPDPQDDLMPDPEFHQQVETAWLVCDRFDLQTDIWRGRILTVIRDREKQRGEGRGSGFLNWLKDHDISKSQAYGWIELADSADTLLDSGQLDPADVNQFSKRAFVEVAQASPEVQQLVSEAAHQGQRITRREVKQLSDEWTAMNSDLLPEPMKAKAADNSIPARYMAPLVRELEKLPEIHQVSLQTEVSQSPDLDTLKQATQAARQLSRYLSAAAQVQCLNRVSLDLEQALDEALRLGCLTLTADLVNQAALLEQTLAKLYTTWKRVGSLSEKLYLNSGASTPHLQSLLQNLERLTTDSLEVPLTLPGSDSRWIRVHIQEDPD